MKKTSSDKHNLGWEDERQAQLTHCGETFLPAGPILKAGEINTCPSCGDKIMLIWNVYVRETGNDRT